MHDRTFVPEGASVKPTLPFPPASNEHLDICALETWL